MKSNRPVRTSTVGIIDKYSGYRCRFCDAKVQPDEKTCPSCGIPYPPQEKILTQFLLRAAAFLLIGAALGSLAGWAIGLAFPKWMFLRWLLLVAGALVGVVVGFRHVRHWEVRLRTRALLRTEPSALHWQHGEIAARVGTPAVSTVASEVARYVRTKG